MQAKPEYDAVALRLVATCFCDGLLKLDGSPKGVHGAAEFGQQPVAG